MEKLNRFFLTSCIVFATAVILLESYRSLSERRIERLNNVITSKHFIHYHDTFVESFQRTNRTITKKPKYVLSYTLFGKNSWERYGANVRNIALETNKSSFYGNWTVRLHHENYPKDLQDNLTSLYNNLEFVDVRYLSVLQLTLINTSVGNIVNMNGMSWRFLPIGDLSVDVMCSRDLDSPLLEREEVAVKYWLDSGRIMHSMRDNPEHKEVIQGGMWCFRNSKNRSLGQRILKIFMLKAEKRQSKEASKGNDQNVLGKFIFPAVKKDIIQHDAYNCRHFTGGIPFTTKRNGKFFVGCVRPCTKFPPKVCPILCRPTDHQNWTYC